MNRTVKKNCFPMWTLKVLLEWLGTFYNKNLNILLRITEKRLFETKVVGSCFPWEKQGNHKFVKIIICENYSNIFQNHVYNGN